MPLPKFIQKFLCCASCKGDDAGGGAGGGAAGGIVSKVSSGFFQEVLDKTVLAQDIVKYAVIATFPKGEVKAKNFEINEKALADIIKALEGDTGNIAEGIALSPNHPVYSPGKVEAGKAIFGTAVAAEEDDAPKGGCAIFKTLSHVLICTFEKDLEGATSFVRKVADGMIEKGQ